MLVFNLLAVHVCVYVCVSELRQGAEQLTRHPNCPAVVSTIIAKMTAFVSSMAPPQVM